MSTNKYIILLLSIFSIPVLGFGDELQWPENDHTKKVNLKKEIKKIDNIPDSVCISDYEKYVPNFIVMDKYTPDGAVLRGNDGIFPVGDLSIDNPIVISDGNQEYVTSENIYNQHNGNFEEIVSNEQCYLHFANNLHWLDNILTSKEKIRLRYRIFTSDYYTSIRYVRVNGVKYVKKYFYKPEYFMLFLIRGDVLELNPYISKKTIDLLIKDKNAYYKVVFPCRKFRP